MTGKLIYLSIVGRNETVEFTTEDSAEDIKELFRVAAEAGPTDLLKLYNAQGSLVCINGRLPSNTPHTRYRLDVVAAECTAERASRLIHTLDFDLKGLIERLDRLEERVETERPISAVSESAYADLHSRLEALSQKLENFDHLSWLGLYKDLSKSPALHPFWSMNNRPKKTAECCQKIFDKATQLGRLQMTRDIREYLRKPTFDNWRWDDAEMLVMMRQMFIDLDLHVKFRIEIPMLEEWLFHIYRRYNDVPFHNFKHSFMVTQMMYGIIWLADLHSHFDDLDILILLISPICHDLDHPGFNNAYQINARTELALRYNDISPLENHHCSVAFEILENKACNILSNLDPDQYKRFREGMIKCILATDMSKHNEILKSFKAIIPSFDLRTKEHKDILMMILMKTADISNECRPMDVAGVWLDCLFQEYFMQSDMEKLSGLPVAPFMDRDKVTKPSAQIGFIQFVLLPLFESLGELYPILIPDIVDPVRAALRYYTDMHEAIEKEKQRKEAAAVAQDPEGTGVH